MQKAIAENECKKLPHFTIYRLAPVYTESIKRDIQKRYYLDKTQMEIAEELNISQAQVSRLEKNALKTMYDCMK